MLRSGRYDRDIRDAIAVQDDIARLIAGALLPRLDRRGASTVPPATPGTGDTGSVPFNGRITRQTSGATTGAAMRKSQ